MTGVALGGLTSMATTHVLAELSPAYATRSGIAVAVESVSGIEAAARVRAEEPCDFVVLARDVIGKLESEGHVLAGSAVDMATSGVAIAVRSGAPLPDVSSESAVRAAVVNSPAVGYSTGPSGIYLLRLFESWGIRPRLVQAPPGVAVGTLLARGEVDLGFQQLSELIPIEGIRIVGPLPREIQLVTTFTGAVCKGSRQPEAAAAFLAFVGSPATAECKTRHGMAQPAPR